MTIDKPVCELSENDGNVFMIIGKVGKALRDAARDATRDGDKEAAAHYLAQRERFQAAAIQAGSYDDVLRLCFDYVEVG